MPKKTKAHQPDFIYHEGKPSAVIIPIDEYLRILERLEDVEDLQTLEEMRKKKLSFRPFDEFLAELES